MTTLDQNNTYTLSLEYMNRREGWWLELIDRASGKVKILKHKQKTFFDGTTIEHALRWTATQEWSAMYKKGVK